MAPTSPSRRLLILDGMSEEKRPVITKNGFKTGFVTVSLSWLAGFHNPGLTFQDLLVHLLSLLAVRYLTHFRWLGAILVYGICAAMGVLYAHILFSLMYVYGFFFVTLPCFVIALTVVSMLCSRRSRTAA